MHSHAIECKQSFSWLDSSVRGGTIGNRVADNVAIAPFLDVKAYAGMVSPACRHESFIFIGGKEI
jgi:hypothetical protein